jgi:hypothetical protein
VGRVVQDVVTRPSKKEILVTGTEGKIKISFGLPGRDAVSVSFPNGNKRIVEFPKTRPEDFITELNHIQDFLENPKKGSPLSLDYGIDVMRAIADVIEQSKNQE